MISAAAKPPPPCDPEARVSLETGLIGLAGLVSASSSSGSKSGSSNCCLYLANKKPCVQMMNQRRAENDVNELIIGNSV